MPTRRRSPSPCPRRRPRYRARAVPSRRSCAARRPADAGRAFGCPPRPRTRAAPARAAPSDVRTTVRSTGTAGSPTARWTATAHIGPRRGREPPDCRGRPGAGEADRPRDPCGRRDRTAVRTSGTTEIPLSRCRLSGTFTSSHGVPPDDPGAAQTPLPSTELICCGSPQTINRASARAWASDRASATVASGPPLTATTSTGREAAREATAASA